MILPYAKIDAFFWDELGCNYVDKNGGIICLYDELDELTERFIKENTVFISLNLKQVKEKFVRKYLEKRQRLNTLI